MFQGELAIFYGTEYTNNNRTNHSQNSNEIYPFKPY